MERLEKLLACCLMVGLCVVLGSTAPAFAQSGAADETWQVLEQHGSVRYRAPGESGWSQAVSGAELPPGARIVTGRDGWVILRRDGGNFWVEPGARFVLPSSDAARVRQDLGDLHYRIIRTEQQHFEVETPYASMVVKGTAFDVRATDAGMAVEVARGWVEVTTPQGARADLRAGQSARISGTDPTLEVQLAPGQAFEPVQPGGQARLATAPAVQPSESGPTDRGAGTGDASEGTSWFERLREMLLDSPPPTPREDWWGAADSGGGGFAGTSSSYGSATSGSSGGSGSSDSGSDSSGSSSGSSGGSSGSSSGSSGSGTSGSGSGSSGDSDGDGDGDGEED